MGENQSDTWRNKKGRANLKEVVSVRVPRATMDTVRVLGDRENTTSTAIINAALEQFLDEQMSGWRSSSYAEKGGALK